MEKEILGHILCRTCMTPKAIMQGNGKRKEYVYGRCVCGPDNRTGKPAQLSMKKFKPLKEVQTEIDAFNTPKLNAQPDCDSKPQPTPKQPQPDCESKPSLSVCMGIGALAGLGLGTLIKTVM